MALSVRAKNLILGGSLATFASAVFGYTFYQMSRDDFKDLDTVKVNVHSIATTVSDYAFVVADYTYEMANVSGVVQCA
ncbi:Hypothetical protein PHPALM_16655, partial [Phytophthora palmivora]